jgi:hypothetical protein
MRTRGLIEQAKGMIAERLGIDPEAAFAYLSQLSQHANVRLVDLAADTVGAARPQDVSPPVTTPPPPTPSSPVPPAPAVSARSERQRAPQSGAADALPASASRALPRLAAALTAARSGDDLLAAVLEAVTWLDPAAVAIFGLAPSSAGRLLYARGWPARTVDDWRRVPSAVPVPANEAMRTGGPVWLDGLRRHDHPLIGPQVRRAVLPLAAGERLVGAVELGWSAGAGFTEPEQRFLTSMALILGPRLAGMATWDPPEDRWLESTLDALPIRVQLLRPVRDPSGALCDFVIDHANAEAMDALVREGQPTIVGRRLLDTEPDLVTSGVLDVYVRAYDGGESIRLDPVDQLVNGVHQRVRRSAIRLGDRLLVTAQALERDAVLGEQGIRMELLGEFGWGEWSATMEPFAWSPGLFHLLGRSPSRGPVSLDRVLARVIPDDRGVAEAMVRGVLTEGREASAELQVDRDGVVRTLRLVAEPRFDHRQRPVAILALLQDVTETRRRDQQLSQREKQLAAQRIHSAAEQAYTDELRRLLYPAAEDRQTTGRLTLNARHIAPKSIQRFRGDFYDIVHVPDGAVLILGDVFGSGVSAATTMVRLRHAARALSLAGVDPAAVLTILNGELGRDAEPPLASLVVARFRHTDSSMAWAQAGHFAPALIRSGRTRSLVRPEGIALGLGRRARYTEATLTLRAADVLVFYTDGVLSGLDAQPDPVAHLVRGFGQAYREGGPSMLLDRYLRPAEDEACVVTVELA